MSLKNKRINLADSFNKKDEKALKRQRMLIYISPAIGLIIVLTGIYGSFLIKTNNVKNDTQTLQQNFEIMKLQAQKTLQLEETNRILISDMEKMKFAVEERKAFNGKNTYFEKNLFSNIKKCGNSKLKISGCTFSGGAMILTMTSSGSNPSNISEFIRNLKGLEYFSNVSYPGYTGGDEYTFNVTCIFK